MWYVSSGPSSCRMSQILILRSSAAVAMCMPCGSIASAVNGTGWHSILARGSRTVGDHIETTPFESATHVTPFHGLCVITDSFPTRQL
uniref:Putative secreted protein n=1 Tax=Anopheles triannulatus TaxID=58253 RepID=A0A2M4B6I7_9DIPT